MARLSEGEWLMLWDLLLGIRRNGIRADVGLGLHSRPNADETGTHDTCCKGATAFIILHLS